MAGKKSNKSKMEGVGVAMPVDKAPQTIAEAAKQNKRISFSIEVEEKILDGKKVVSGRISSYDIPGEKPREEYTDMAKLEEKANKMIEEFFSAIEKSGK